MELENLKAGEILVVTPLDHRMDAYGAPDFKEKMSAFINEGNSRVVLNLSEVDFIDSSGLGSIISALKMLGTNGNMVICCVKSTVMSMFELTRMDRVFQIFTTKEQAVAALSN
ncbi:MAG: STAS domain-containing protein [bacterium]